MITPEFLQSCTDEQINKGVSWLEASRASIKRIGFFIASKYYANSVTMGCATLAFTPCNNPNDSWPIILENKIDIFLILGIRLVEFATVHTSTLIIKQEYHAETKTHCAQLWRFTFL